MNAKQIIYKEYGNSTNFITPNVIEYGKRGNYAYELSYGTGISGNRIYGLSIVSYDPETGDTKREYELSGCYDSRELAQEAIDNL